MWAQEPCLRNRFLSYLYMPLSCSSDPWSSAVSPSTYTLFEQQTDSNCKSSTQTPCHIWLQEDPLWTRFLLWQVFVQKREEYAGSVPSVGYCWRPQMCGRGERWGHANFDTVMTRSLNCIQLKTKPHYIKSHNGTSQQKIGFTSVKLCCFSPLALNVFHSHENLIS